MKISVVIPTYNRTEQLNLVIDWLLKSETDGIENVEIIVVDDGSENSARLTVENKRVEPPYSLKYIFQENAGPAAARNNGFRAAENEIVLFVDDDVLVLPRVLKQHLEAHSAMPRSVVHGPYPYFPMEAETSAYRYLNSLVEDGNQKVVERENPAAEYIRVEMVASGNLSVEKSLFDDEVYGRGLEVPVAEEYDLMIRLKKRDVPIYFAKHIKAWHLQPPTIEDKCKQEYKYGLGLAEVFQKNKDVAEMNGVKILYDTNREILAADLLNTKVKKIIRSFTANRLIREMMLKIVKISEKSGLKDDALFAFYKLLVGSYFTAGVKDGIKVFSKEEK